jgi:hypothetical protein
MNWLRKSGRSVCNGNPDWDLMKEPDVRFRGKYTVIFDDNVVYFRHHKEWRFIRADVTQDPLLCLVIAKEVDDWCIKENEND